MQRMGVPKAAVDCLFTTLQTAIHRVRTGYGDSKEHYGGQTWLIPFHGIGQGNGAGPAIWAVVSTPLLNTLRKMGFGLNYITPISNTLIKFSGFAFVDDTDLLQLLQHNSSGEEVRHDLSCGTSKFLTKPVKILKICLVKGIPHNFNIHVIQVI